MFNVKQSLSAPMFTGVAGSSIVFIYGYIISHSLFML